MTTAKELTVSQDYTIHENTFIYDKVTFTGDYKLIVADCHELVIETVEAPHGFTIDALVSSGANGRDGEQGQDQQMLPGGHGTSAGNGARGTDMKDLSLKFGHINGNMTIIFGGGNGGNGGRGGDGGRGGADFSAFPGGNGGNGGNGGDGGNGAKISIQYKKTNGQFVLKAMDGIGGRGGNGGTGGAPASFMGAKGLDGNPGVVGKSGKESLVVIKQIPDATAQVKTSNSANGEEDLTISQDMDIHGANGPVVMNYNRMTFTEDYTVEFDGDASLNVAKLDAPNGSTISFVAADGMPGPNGPNAPNSNSAYGYEGVSGGNGQKGLSMAGGTLNLGDIAGDLLIIAGGGNGGPGGKGGNGGGGQLVGGEGGTGGIGGDGGDGAEVTIYYRSCTGAISMKGVGGIGGLGGEGGDGGSGPTVGKKGKQGEPGRSGTPPVIRVIKV